ncbi:MAG: hypothetical protein RR246_05480 [Clostridia bacterium]
MRNITDNVCLVLPNGVSCSAVASDGSNYCAVDGRCPNIFIFDSSGCFSDQVNSLRPYRKLRHDCASDGYVALGTSCASRVFYLNSRLEEIGSISLECATSSDRHEITDIGVSHCGGILEAAHRQSIRNYTFDGEYYDTIAQTTGKKIYKGYASLQDCDATYYTSENHNFLKIGCNTVPIPNCTELLSFIPCNNMLYGAFKSRYIYNYIIPIYSDGHFICENILNFAFLGNNTSSNCCN